MPHICTDHARFPLLTIFLGAQRYAESVWEGFRVKTVIYLDELLLVNFVIAAILLLSAGLFTGRQCTAARLCLASGLAALSTLSLLAPELPLPAALACKVGSCAAIVAAAYGLPGLRSFLRLCAWYLLMNLLLCGAVVLPGVQANNLNIFLPISPGRLLVCCGAVYAGLQGVLYCFGRSPARSIAAVLELADGTRLSVQAFYDTGFSVQEPLSGRAVVLVQYRPVRPQLPAEVRRFLDGYFAGEGSVLPPQELGLRLIPCRTVNGHSLLPALPANTLCAANRHTPALWAAFCDTDASGGEWTLLYGNDTAQLLEQQAHIFRRTSP